MRQSMPFRRMDHSAPRAWASLRPSVCRPQLPMPSTTRLACGSRNCPLVRKRFSVRYAPKPIGRSGTNDMGDAGRSINFTLNGRPVSVEVKAHHNVVEMLQTQFALFGARESCGQGLCGCCTVMVDGQPVSGCIYLAVFLDGADVVTIEHLGEAGTLD